MPTDFGWRLRPMLVLLVLAGALTCTGGCGGDGSSVTGLDMEDLVGTYSLTKLSFDPQGALPEADILGALGTVPELIVTTNNQAQIVYRDPISALFSTISASTKATKTGLRVSFGGNSAYADLLLARSMDLVFSEAPGTLSFDDESPDGVRRQKLTRLIQDWVGEQLFDPVPGRLRVTFQRK
ncbi:MAG: hypothetical protein KJN92_11790 [Gemmatimonadetes bacterium]|nr:hypothetical protein [Gemmatimonadota bacterium]